MKIAVVGAGYAGLAVAWYLLQAGTDVTVFDGGQGASHISTGLLHPAPGRRIDPIWRAEEGMAAALALLEVASKERPLFERSGILRIATTEEQRGIFGGDTLWVPEGVTVYSKLYLEGLRNACGKAQFEGQWVQNLQELDSFDAIVLTVGSEALRFADLPLKKNIGQSLLCRWPERLKMGLLSHCHITPTEDPGVCMIGSTYEHTERPDPQKALELLERAALFYPPARNFKVIEIFSAVRIAPINGYHPIVARLDQRTWIFTGLGSKGLIYHALLAQELATSLISEVEYQI